MPFPSRDLPFPSRDLRRLNVLIVDRDIGMRSLLNGIFRSFHVGSTLAVAPGAEALRALGEFPADIIILDGQMEPVDELAFMHELRRSKTSRNPFAHVIMLSSYPEPHHVAWARDAGVSEILVKPVTAGRLYERVSRTLERSRDFVEGATFAGPDRRHRASDISQERRLAS